ncbi:hypothetical protein LOC67_05785 [Stieleria sp. JC731]|uniref:hypothetical protein n=1 Tax=Pirellulaceae TaxID=2691357 RepID=UPI001E4C45C7|nr:hypothetical protein [Stieleria sp. JC731]MCC9600064.1 hypothetical protein [Stieleria sp. JC731]
MEAEPGRGHHVPSEKQRLLLDDFINLHFALRSRVEREGAELQSLVMQSLEARAGGVAFPSSDGGEPIESAPFFKFI